MKTALAFDVYGTLVVRRSEKKIFDPWGIERSVVVRSLSELSDALEAFS
jgi:hypothetical protein